MHERGVHFDVTTEDSSLACLLKIARWDFQWQEYYFYRQPIRINFESVVLSSQTDLAQHVNELSTAEMVFGFVIVSEFVLPCCHACG